MDFEEVKDKIYPWIKVVYAPDEEDISPTLEIELNGSDQEPVYQDWLGNLAIFYAVDEGEQFSLLFKEDLPDDLSIEELHDIATSNLDRDVEFTFNQTNFGGYGLIAGGDHEAGSLCLGGIWEWCSEELNDSLVVAVAAKDMVMMVPASDNEKISELKTFVNQLF